MRRHWNSEGKDLLSRDFSSGTFECWQHARLGKISYGWRSWRNKQRKHASIDFSDGKHVKPHSSSHANQDTPERVGASEEIQEQVGAEEENEVNVVETEKVIRYSC